MRRHSIIARLGLNDRAAISVSEPASEITTLQYVRANRRIDYGLGDTLENLQCFGISPSEIAFDLLLIAATVYCADTRIDRRTESQDSWTREIDIYVPVAEPNRWSSLSQHLSEMLEFLTGDKWRLFFRSRPDAFSSVVRRLPARRSNLPNAVALFSGGLDSFIGAIDLFEQGTDPLLISHNWVSNASGHQSACEGALARHYGARRVRRGKSPIGFPKDIIPCCGNENTERSRSFLFLAVAALAASGLDIEDLPIFVPENGLISLNIPLDPLRLGSLSTRTTHPYFMSQFQRLLGGLGISTTLHNPYRHQTKGQMIQDCKNQTLLASNSDKTMSCSSPNKGRFSGESPGHCGYCLPCLIRRAALLNFPDPTRYKLSNLQGASLKSTKAEGDSVRSFQLAIARLNNDPRRAKVLIHKSGPLSGDPAELHNLARVYLAGMREVAHLLSGVTTRP
jgi:7-cyano-7-deazaguanine synthase in queuosine biosynthesis